MDWLKQYKHTQHNSSTLDRFNSGRKGTTSQGTDSGSPHINISLRLSEWWYHRVGITVDPHDPHDFRNSWCPHCQPSYSLQGQPPIRRWSSNKEDILSTISPSAVANKQTLVDPVLHRSPWKELPHPWDSSADLQQTFIKHYCDPIAVQPSDGGRRGHYKSIDPGKSSFNLIPSLPSAHLRYEIRGMIIIS